MNQIADIAKPRDDYAQQMPKYTPPVQTKPSMGSKLQKVAEIFELDIIDDVEALKACKTIILQHAKTPAFTGKV